MDVIKNSIFKRAMTLALASFFVSVHQMGASETSVIRPKWDARSVVVGTLFGGGCVAGIGLLLRNREDNVSIQRALLAPLSAEKKQQEKESVDQIAVKQSEIKYLRNANKQLRTENDQLREVEVVRQKEGLEAELVVLRNEKQELRARIDAYDAQHKHESSMMNCIKTRDELKTHLAQSKAQLKSFKKLENQEKLTILAGGLVLGGVGMGIWHHIRKK